MSQHNHHDSHEHERRAPGHNHDQEHEHEHGFWEQLAHLLPWNGHSHDYTELAGDEALQTHVEGIRTIWLALGALLLTTVIQVVIVVLSGSVALLADTVHNLGDGLNSIPLLIAFYLARRAATRRYSYGFGRAEDVAGIFIVLSIAISAGVIFWESFQKFLDPEPISNLPWVVAAAIVGFVGNEAVALLQIRVGRKIGSAAMVADGLHARTDGLTSLAVLLAAGGSWLGYPIVDPIIGALIGFVILFITRDAIVTMWYRLMDAVEPEYMEQAERVVQGNESVEEFCRLRMRWIGHRMHAEVVIAVDPDLTTAEGHQIAEVVRHELFHEIPQLSEVVVHVEPAGVVDEAHHGTVHHEAVPRPLE
ncbi:MAG TPA: cation diffusion facilitator family transporter [Candidatus Sulfomarinibacteraceae bacterium]|nr:cation diffusion facilitator family transporter [Candidatus Sulfomarinibacteraceae bacterium]